MKKAFITWEVGARYILAGTGMNLHQVKSDGMQKLAWKYNAPLRENIFIKDTTGL